MATLKQPSLPARSTLPVRNSGGSRLARPLIALAALVVVAGASVATTWMITTRQQAAAPALGADGQPQVFTAAPSAPPPVPSPIFLPLEPFTVTLQNEDMERILHVGVTLRLADEQSRLRLEKYLPEARSRILMLLSSQAPQSIQTPQGKTDLASTILKAVNRPFSPMVDGQYVTDVLFTAFVVQ